MKSKKVEIWAHFKNGKVAVRHFETCKDVAHARTLIEVMENKNRIDEQNGYKTLGIEYSIEPYGTKDKLGQIVYR